MTMSAVLETVFWVSVAAIGWTYVGFPLLLALRRPLPAPRRTPGAPLPRVSYVIVVHNERAVIEAKLANVEALDLSLIHI